MPEPDPGEPAAAPGDAEAGSQGTVPTASGGRRRLRWRAGLSGGTVLAVAIAAAWAGTGYAGGPLLTSQADDAAVATSAVGADPGQLATRLEREHRRLRAGLARVAPRGIYVVIDQTQNRLYVMQGQDVLHRAICSAGSGLVLKEGRGGRTWVFDTPRGRFSVRSKRRNPVWRKPDWAFVEEGQPIPSRSADRIEYGTLGEYALYFGDGFMIHGTLYERLLGRNVSHGCIRLGRDDLRTVYSLVPVGTPIFIY